MAGLIFVKIMEQPLFMQAMNGLFSQNRNFQMRRIMKVMDSLKMVLV